MQEKDRQLFEVYIDDAYLTEHVHPEIIRRNKIILINFGEEVYLFKRRWSGIVCTHPTITTSDDEEYEDQEFFDDDLNVEEDEDDDVIEIIHRCPDCFGTGFFGGYYKQQIIKIRYGNIPKQIVRMTDSGIEVAHDYNSWTLLEPKLDEKDVIIRQNGERFEVADPGQSEWRGKPLHQIMFLNKLEPHDIAYQVNDKNIQLGLNNVSDETAKDWSDFSGE